MSNILLLGSITIAYILSQVNGDNNSNCNREVIHTGQIACISEGEKDSDYWKHMTEGISRALITNFRGHFDGYTDRNYFNY